MELRAQLRGFAGQRIVRVAQIKGFGKQIHGPVLRARIGRSGEQTSAFFKPFQAGQRFSSGFGRMVNGFRLILRVGVPGVGGRNLRIFFSVSAGRKRRLLSLWRKYLPASGIPRSVIPQYYIRKRFL